MDQIQQKNTCVIQEDNGMETTDLTQWKQTEQTGGGQEWSLIDPGKTRITLLLCLLIVCSGLKQTSGGFNLIPEVSSSRVPHSYFSIWMGQVSAVTPRVLDVSRHLTR